MEYELLFFTSVANEDKIDPIKKDVTEILESLGGKLLNSFSDIGKRKLAYPIKRNTHAFYSFARFLLEEKQNIPEINKRLGLYDKIMRHIIVRADEIGKPIVSQEVKFEEEVEKKARERKEKPTRPTRFASRSEREPEIKPTEKKPKATLEDLDEKLSEILEETPE